MKLSSLRIRRWFLGVACLAVAGVFVARLVEIQIINVEEYRLLQERRSMSVQTLRAVRGEIVDRNMRPITVNRMGYDVVFDFAWFPSSESDQNEAILNLIELSEQLGVEWVDALPLTSSPPYAVLPGGEAAMGGLRTALSLQPYATAQDAMFRLVQEMNLEEFPADRQRQIAGIRYGMSQPGRFALNVNYTFASDIDRMAAIRIAEHSYMLPGVRVVENAMRHHVDGQLAPHIIGHVTPIFQEELQTLIELGYSMDDTIGRDGVEGAFESYLRGTNGRREIHLDRGSVVMEVESGQPIPGHTVVLSLDVELQLVLQRALANQIHHLQRTFNPGQGREANAGSAVVLDVRTGEILAIATYPSYDLTTHRQDFSELVADTELTPLVNRALQGSYAPGSVFKPVVALAGLEAGMITPNTAIACRRFFPVGGHTFTCLSYHGPISLNRAMAVSCNIYFYDIGRRLGIDAIDRVAAALGLGVPSGIELPENIGQRSNPESKLEIMGESWFEGDTVQSSIGQLLHGFSPLQLANFTSTIAARGQRMEITIAHEVRDYSLQNVIRPFEPRVAYDMSELISRATFEAVVDSMVAASRPGGTAQTIFGWYPIDVGSKTGSPETANTVNSAFVAFAPAAEPEIAIAIVIERGWHGFTSAPVARAVFDAYFGFAPPTPPTPAPADNAAEQTENEEEEYESEEAEELS